MHVRKVLIPKQPHGSSRIHHDPYVHNPTKIHDSLQHHGKDTQWVNIFKSNQGNVWNTTSQQDCT